MLSRESLLAFQLTRQPLTDRESENHGRRHSDFSLAISLDAVAKSVGVAALPAWLALLAAARSHVTKRGGLRKRRRAKPVKSRQARQTGRADACSLARLAQGDVRSCYCCCRSLAARSRPTAKPSSVSWAACRPTGACVLLDYSDDDYNTDCSAVCTLLSTHRRCRPPA